MLDITINNLTKSYPGLDRPAIKDITFSVNKGELFGLIGPDGAGKTTLLRVLTTLLLPDEGVATVNDLDIIKDFKEIRKKVGYMPGKFSLYQDLTVLENLTFFATIFNTTIEENYDLIKEIYIQIEPFKDRRAGKLSGGMKQKLALCCALIHRPSVLFLDEPTTGVDVVSRKEFWEMLKRLKEQGITILVSTPYMDEASLCERIALIQDGEIMSIDTPDNITKQFPDKLFAIRSDDMSKLLKDLRHDTLIKSSYSFGDSIHITFIDVDELTISELQNKLNQLEHKSIEIEIISPTIEDCFIRLMNKTA
ncbi:MAG: ABC transporter ATP-binding protein [Saprospiraceae bacterium]|jgi:ABC-2 type transport system ATP-binding protein|uniref:ABC transporter ATP-binding protein n=1 Tax=Candidatus Brachybacter algidus TaxID=2982024 RepID=UPI001B6F3AE3|nr:ABC transporter ATP-binding protein [Candidatus Brachybacter algidus]MBP7306197.1 ABC transporter ATP-binding protein [Saprospiraceae bacterium]MBK6375267.1 ABC transporter ATP-binding protein [Candidatus Brachybacter algidus]MBK6449630.1 ABC transporter ATP-binding protein [Candidatus Brachybacter algidus]MBK7604483.1 ABC transporter ATP-binding protein [Candidatus Brachybacter algidus]MBK8747504.1 ABC transporter ATP-binding protein [Candidatus Brachybacter algidus]